MPLVALEVAAITSSVGGCVGGWGSQQRAKLLAKPGSRILLPARSHFYVRLVSVCLHPALGLSLSLVTFAFWILGLHQLLILPGNLVLP